MVSYMKKLYRAIPTKNHCILRELIIYYLLIIRELIIIMNCIGDVLEQSHVSYGVLHTVDERLFLNTTTYNTLMTQTCGSSKKASFKSVLTAVSKVEVA